MDLRWLEEGDPLFASWIRLRLRVLREPLGLSFTAADFKEEVRDRHLVGIESGLVVAGLMVRPLAGEPPRWKLRQVAVDPSSQREGRGRALLAAALSEASLAGVEEVVLHSRVEVCPFYERFGFRSVGADFPEIGIPHRKMALRLPSP